MLLGAAGALDLNGRNVTVNGLMATAGAVVDNTAADPAVLTVGDADADTTGTAAFNGTIRNTGGPLSLTKVCTGAFRMQTAPSTYAGDTTVAAGALDLNGLNLLPSGTGRGDVRVNAGATLGLRFAQSVTAPAWLNGAAAPDPRELLPFPVGTLHVPIRRVLGPTPPCSKRMRSTSSTTRPRRP